MSLDTEAKEERKGRTRKLGAALASWPRTRVPAASQTSDQPETVGRQLGSSWVVEQSTQVEMGDPGTEQPGDFPTCLDLTSLSLYICVSIHGSWCDGSALGALPLQT